MKKKVIEIFANKGIFISENEIENLASAIQETIEAIADKTEEEEPYAVNSITRLREAASDVYTELTN